MGDFMDNIRKMRFCGAKYPSDVDLLSSMTKTEGEGDSGIHAIIVPTGSYKNISNVYRQIYQKVKNVHYDSVIIVSPKATTSFLSIALTSYDYFECPFGNLAVDQDANKILNDFRSEFIVYNNHYHNEVSFVEEQLPFIASTLGLETKIVPIIIGEPNTKFTIMLANALAKLIDEGNKTNKKYLIIVTTSLTQNNKYETALKQDKFFTELLSKMKPDPFSEQLALGQIEANGGGGVTVLLRLAEKLEYTNMNFLSYYNTGDDSDDKLRTNGYITAFLK
jgi:hypothetical protein